MSDSSPALPRTAGVLLHPSSLPGPFGVGDLGPMAFRWVDTLAAMKQRWWQILPLGPTGAGDSPYQSFSAFAGNINLLSPEALKQDGLVEESLWAGQTFSEEKVDFARVTPFKKAVLRAAWDGFHGGRGNHLRAGFEAYVHQEAWWLHDFALFMAIRDALGGVGLAKWPDDVFRRTPSALAALETELGSEISLQKFGQFLFDRQWTAVKRYANEHGIRLIGDIPIFVSPDSVDVWANRSQFLVDEHGAPTVVAGVPPDYFAEDGQHWGNPIYDWRAMAADGYRWWTARVRHALRQVDLIRLDHFRGFAQAWHIPAGEKTARNGKWVDGPGRPLFDCLHRQLGSLPFIAEDLGLITPDVHAMREGLGLPGMRVLQFMLGGPDNPYLPHNYDPNTVCYTGTHDNETTAGWYAGLQARDHAALNEYLGHPITQPAWELVRMAWATVARLAVAPLQDLLGVDGRMNKPGVPDGNWSWRVRMDQFPAGLVERVAALTQQYNRLGVTKG